MERIEVLIAEDEPLVAKALERQLARYADTRGLGMDVRVAPDGLAAVRAAQDPDRDWAAILLDYRLPLLDGEGVWRSLALARPELLPRIVFVTQAPDELRGEHEGGKAPILPKPFPFETLARLLDAVLRRPQAAGKGPGKG